LLRAFENMFVGFSSIPLSLNHYSDQFAFRPTGNTTAALMQLFHDVSAMLQSNE
jgi:hypothetical protein